MADFIKKNARIRDITLLKTNLLKLKIMQCLLSNLKGDSRALNVSTFKD